MNVNRRLTTVETISTNINLLSNHTKAELYARPLLVRYNLLGHNARRRGYLVMIIYESAIIPPLRRVFSAVIFTYTRKVEI